MNLEEKFKELVDMLAPPLPEEIGGMKLRKKINDILAPTLLHKYLPPMPKGLASLIKERNGNDRDLEMP